MNPFVVFITPLLICFLSFFTIAQKVNSELLSNELLHFETFTPQNDTTGKYLFSRDTIYIYLGLIHVEDSLSTPKKFKKLEQRSQNRALALYRRLQSWSFYFDPNNTFNVLTVRPNSRCIDLERNMVKKNCSESIYSIHEYRKSTLLLWKIESNRLILTVDDKEYKATKKKFKNDRLILVKKRKT